MIPAGLVLVVGVWLFGVLSPYKPLEEPEWRKIKPEGEPEPSAALETWAGKEEERREDENRAKAPARLRISWIIAALVLILSYLRIIPVPTLFGIGLSGLPFGFYGLPFVLAYFAWSAYWGWTALGSPHFDDAIMGRGGLSGLPALFAAMVYGICGGGILQYRYHARLAAGADADPDRQP